MPNSRFYSSIAATTTLQVTANSGDINIQVASSSGWPGSFPYIVCLDYGAANEELVLVTSGGPNVFTVTRGYDGTSASTHNAGAVVRHVSSAIDFTDSRTHEASTTNVHGITGAFVDTTSAQTLSNKTLSSPTINSATVTGTVAATGSTVTNGTFTTPILTTPTINGAALSGTITGTPTFSGVNTFSAGIIANGETLQRTNGTDITLTSKRIADAGGRLNVTSDGVLNWGDGTGPTDTNLYRAGASSLQTDDAFTAASVTTAGTVTAGGLTTSGNLSVTGIGGTLFARKAVSTNRNSTTTNTADPDITFTVASNAIYEVTGMLVYSGDPNGDLKIGFSGPASTTFTWAGTAQNAAATSATGPVITDAQSIAGTNFQLGCLSGTNLTCKIEGILRTSLTSGTFSLNWSQVTSSATDTIMAADTFLVLRRLA